MNRVFLCLYFAATCAAAPFEQIAAGAIEGKVTGSGGAPLEGAIVRLKGKTVESTTAADGSVRISGLSAGEYFVEVTAPGYFPSQATRVDLTAELTAAVEVVLELNTVVSETVVVTGTRTPHLAVDAPVRTDVISGLVCERRATRVLAEALTSTASGLRIESNCQNCGFMSVRLNGLQGQYTQILEDGLPTVSGVSMVYAIDQIPTDFVSSIEVVKGGASALYGPSAVGGIINLIRKEPRGNTFSLDTQTGWQRGRPETSYGAMTQLEHLPAGFSADVYFRGLRRTQVDRDGDGFTEMARRRSSSGGGTLFRRFFDGKARLTLGGSVLSEYRRGGDLLDLPPDRTNITEMAETMRSAGFVRWNHTLDANTFYSVASSVNYLSRDTYYGAGFDPNAYGSTGNPLWIVDAQLGRQEGRHTLLGGFQFQREQVRDTIPAYGRAYRDLFRNSGLYVQDEIRLVPRVTVVAGLRTDKSNTLDHWVFSPRGNVRVGLNDRWNLRLGLSTGFRAPVIFDEDLHVTQVGGTGLVLRNAPGLQEEKSFSRNLAVDYTGAVGGTPFQAGMSLFWTSLRDVHVFQESLDNADSGFRTLLRVNGSGSHVRGAEFDLNWRARRFLGVRSGFTFQQARYQEPEPDFGSLRYFRTPNRYGFVGLDVDLPKEVDLTASGDFTGSMVVPHYAGYILRDRLERSGSFAVLSATVSRTFRPPSWDRAKVRLYLRLGNMTDSFQRDLDRGPLRDSGYFYGPTEMRTVITGMTLTF